MFKYRLWPIYKMAHIGSDLVSDSSPEHHTLTHPHLC